MQKTLGIAMFLTLSAASAAYAQYPDTAMQGTYTAPSSSQAAPITRAYPGQRSAPAAQIFDSQPASGISVRGDVSNGVEIVTATSDLTELRIAQGRADVTIHHPADHSQILVDLSGGQVSLLKDGLYTFNAATNTVRVLHGEAEAYAGAKDSTSKGTKVKETQQLAFFRDAKLKAVEAYPYELTADLLPGGAEARGDGARGDSYGGRFYGGYPYYAYGYGSPWGYGVFPYGYGYPFGVGVGFGYYGGFRGGYGGYRGGFRR